MPAPRSQPRVGPTPLIDSMRRALLAPTPTQVALCFACRDTVGGPGSLDPAKVAGKIVVCERGVTRGSNKSLAVQEAGGVGHDPRSTRARQLDQC